MPASHYWHPTIKDCIVIIYENHWDWDDFDRNSQELEALIIQAYPKKLNLIVYFKDGKPQPFPSDFFERVFSAYRETPHLGYSIIVTTEPEIIAFINTVITYLANEAAQNTRIIPRFQQAETFLQALLVMEEVNKLPITGEFEHVLEFLITYQHTARLLTLMNETLEELKFDKILKAYLKGTGLSKRDFIRYLSQHYPAAPTPSSVYRYFSKTNPRVPQDIFVMRFFSQFVQLSPQQERVLLAIWQQKRLKAKKTKVQ